MHPDHKPYYYLASRFTLQKSIETVAGLFHGIAIDQELTDGEAGFLRAWLDQHRNVAHRHPFNEILPVIEMALEDNIITQEERLDILWLCKKLSSIRKSPSNATRAMQRLHGVLGGIIADGEIKMSELEGLREWMDNHDILKTCWPYDEIDALLTTVMADGRIDQEEHNQLLNFFSEFVAIEDDRTITNPVVAIDQTITGICACCPDICFQSKTFCFTGSFSQYTREEAGRLVESLGGQVAKNVSQKVDYLVIGSDGNPCWAYACYGRKVEKAVQLRKEGAKLLLVHENDFLDEAQNYI